MDEGRRRTRLLVGPDVVPIMPRYVKLRHDKGRDRWVLLAPERILTPNAIAIEVLKRCNGIRSVQDIAEDLAKGYDASVDDIIGDVIEMLQGMADKGYVRAGAEQ